MKDLQISTTGYVSFVDNIETIMYVDEQESLVFTLIYLTKRSDANKLYWRKRRQWRSEEKERDTQKKKEKNRAFSLSRSY